MTVAVLSSDDFRKVKLAEILFTGNGHKPLGSVLGNNHAIHQAGTGLPCIGRIERGFRFGGKREPRHFLNCPNAGYGGFLGFAVMVLQDEKGLRNGKV